MHFFHLSKIGWFFLDPGNILIGLILLGFVLLFTRFAVIGQSCIGGALLVLLTVIMLPIDNLLLSPFENRYPVLTQQTLPKHIDGIIVLGGAVNPPRSITYQQIQLAGSAERITAMLELAEIYPKARLVYTGGSGSLHAQKNKEADIVSEWLHKFYPVIAQRTIFENQSRNTFENAALSKQLVKPTPNETWLLVTSASHMPRAKAVFDKQGWSVIPYPVDFETYGNIWEGHDFDVIDNLYLLRKAIKEYVGTLAYRLTGKI